MTGERRSLGAFLAIAAIAAPAVLARAGVAPTNTSAPTVSGTAREGNTLAANNGNWTNTPTSFTYQWQKCDSGGASCTKSIAGATTKTYSVTTGDVDSTLRVVVTAVNADGQTPRTQGDRRRVILPAPVNTAAPSDLREKSGRRGAVGFDRHLDRRRAVVHVSMAALRFGRRVLRGCRRRNRSHLCVRVLDVGNTLRVVVTAKNASGSTNATSLATAVVTAIGVLCRRPETRHRP